MSKPTKPTPRKIRITGWTLTAWSKALVVDALKILPILALCAGCEAKLNVTSKPLDPPLILESQCNRSLLVVAENAWLRGQRYELLKIVGQDPSEFTREATTNFIAKNFGMGGTNQ